MNFLKKLISMFTAFALTACCMGLTLTNVYAVTTVEHGDFVYIDSSDGWYIYSYIGGNPTVELPKSFGGETVEGIYDNCFQNSTVSSVTIPNGYTYIGGRAFEGCRNLASVSLPESIKNIGTGAFRDSSVTTLDLSGTHIREIKPFTFENCRALSEVTLSDSISEIGISAFAGSSITDIVIPAAVTELKADTFFGTDSLRTVTLSYGLEKIGDRCFRESGVKSLELPESVLSIGEDAFRDSSLESIYIPNAATQIGPNALFPMSVQSKVEVTCFEGSYADDYCYENFVQKTKTYKYVQGDANLDGVLNILDTTKIQKYKAGLTELEGPCSRLLADTNLDNSISVRDATLIQMYIADIITHFPIN